MTARRAVVLALLTTLWCYAAWQTRAVDSDRPTSLQTPPRQPETGMAQPAWEAPQPRTRLREASRSRQPSSTANARLTLPAVLLRIRWCESRDQYDAENPTSTASGAWQILDGTWNGWRGYARAVHAPRRVQDAKALVLYRDRGTKPWNASRRCWS